MTGDSSVATGVVLRPYRDADEAEILDLLRLSLGGGPGGERSPGYFRWKHLENPFGRSYMLVAKSDDRIVGFRALMRWRFHVEDRVLEAVRPVDTATHPDHRGHGVFSMLTRAALDALQGEVDLVFNTPNPESLAGYKKMGWQVVGDLRPTVRVSRPFGRPPSSGGAEDTSRMAHPMIAAPTATECLADDEGLVRLIETAEVPVAGLSTPLSAGYLRWRYGAAPLLDYHAVREEQRGELVGVALFRPRRQGRRWGLVVSQILVRPGDARTARSLLKRVRCSTHPAFVATLFPRRSTAARATRSLLSIPSPRTITLAVNPLRADLRPDPLLRSSWALSTGDLEVF